MVKDIKEDAKKLLGILLERHESKSDDMIDDLAWDRIGMHPKRTNACLEKFQSRGWLECGVSLRTGWLTPEGIAAARYLLTAV